MNSSLDPFAMLRSLMEVRGLIGTTKPDVLISYTIKPVILGALAAHAEGVPTIVSLITGVGYAFTEGREPKRRLSRRHDVKPGITGLAQVKGRNAIRWEKKFAVDLWYVDHWSLGLDAKILAASMRSVVSRSGISAEGEATMPEFEGSKDQDDAPIRRS